MPRGNRRRRPKSSHIEKEVHALKRELALVAPPKVENKLVTVVEVFDIQRNGALPIINNPAANLSFSGNGWYQFDNININPVYKGIPQEAQIDLAFAMYKYWTPIRVRIQVLPYKLMSDTAQDVRINPMYTVKDLDLGMGVGDYKKLFPAKGHKPFAAHGAWEEFHVDYPGLDRIALQKQQKNMFLTNGSWAAREQMRDPACIQLYAVDPRPLNNVQTTFAQVVFEYQVRVSDRVDPNQPAAVLPSGSAETITQIKEVPAEFVQAGSIPSESLQIQELKVIIDQLKAATAAQPQGI